MVVPRIWVPIPKTRVNCPNVKNNLFLHFLVSLCKKISSGWQSDNFDPRRSAYGSSESLCPIFFKTPAKKVIIFKIVGASPLQSQVIQNLDTQKRCFLGTFFEKMAIFTHFDQTNPPHETHRWKAVHLSFPGARRKISFLRPVSRENFANALGQTCIHDLRLCRNETAHLLIFISSISSF